MTEDGGGADPPAQAGLTGRPPRPIPDEEGGSRGRLGKSPLTERGTPEAIYPRPPTGTSVSLAIRSSIDPPITGAPASVPA